MLKAQDLQVLDVPPLPPRARGAVRVSSKAINGRSVLDDLHQAGSLKVVFPRIAGGPLQAVTVNTAGGITGGDCFDGTFEARSGTELTVTTQAAERAYAAQDAIGRLNTILRVEAGGSLNWLPQETILFENSNFERTMLIDLGPGARLLFVEPLVFGRMAMGEALRAATFRDRVTINRNDAPLFQDAMQFTGDINAHLDRTAAGAGAFASVVFVAPDAEAHLNAVYDALPRYGGASLLQPDVLHIRLLAQDSFVLRQSLIPILSQLIAGPLPRVWMI